MHMVFGAVVEVVLLCLIIHGNGLVLKHEKPSSGIFIELFSENAAWASDFKIRSAG